MPAAVEPIDVQGYISQTHQGRPWAGLFALTRIPTQGIPRMMSRTLHRVSSRHWLAPWVLLAGLLLGPFGVEAGVLAWTDSEDTCCDDDQPHEEEAAAPDAHHDHEEEPCPEDGSDGECPPGCDDCACCPGAGVAVAPSIEPCPDSPPEGDVLAAPPYGGASGVVGRVFRPPKPSLV